MSSPNGKKNGEHEDSLVKPAKIARIDSGNQCSSKDALEELAAKRGLPPPKYKFSDAYAVSCTVRDHTFRAVCKSFVKYHLVMR